MEEGHKSIGAEHCALFLLDEPYDPKQPSVDQLDRDGARRPQA